MARPIVLLHGYGGASSTFAALKAALLAHHDAVTEVALADYVSRDDTVTFDDLARLFGRVLADERPTYLTGGFDLVAHSAGALVARAWVQRYAPRPCALRHLVLLAPANFGSRLAHHGNAVLGRLYSGVSGGDWQTGRHILEALELASPFQWALAQEERYGQKDPNAPWTFVITGNRSYAGLRRVWAPANEPDADGTVRVASTSLDTAFAHARLSPSQAGLTAEPLSPAPPLLVLDGADHASVCRDIPRLLPPLLECLSVATEARYHAVDQRWTQRTARAYAAYHPTLVRRVARCMPWRPHQRHAFAQMVVRVMDDAGTALPDYRVDLWARSPTTGVPDSRWTRRVDQRIVHHVHTHSADRSMRCVYLDATEAHWLTRRAELMLSLTVEDAAHGVSTGASPLAPLRLTGASSAPHAFPRAHATTLLHITVPTATAAASVRRRFRIA